MSAPHPIDEVKRQLAAAGLPTAYIRRVVRELAEHVEDAEGNALVVIDDAERLTAEFVAAYRRGSWIGRRPILSYIVLCLLATPAVWLSYHLVLGFGAAWLLPKLRVLRPDSFLFPFSPTADFSLRAIFYSGRVVPFALAAALVATACARLGRGRGPGAACVLVQSLLALSCFAALAVPHQAQTAAGIHMAMYFGFSRHPVFGGLDLQVQLLQAALVLVVGLTGTWATFRRRGLDRLTFT